MLFTLEAADKRCWLTVASRTFISMRTDKISNTFQRNATVTQPNKLQPPKPQILIKTKNHS